MSCFGLVPPFMEEGDFGFSPDQWGEPSWLSNIQATGGPTLTEHVVEVHGLGDAPQCLGTQVLTGEIALHEAIGRVTDGNRIGLRQALDAGGNIRGLAEG